MRLVGAVALLDLLALVPESDMARAQSHSRCQQDNMRKQTFGHGKETNVHGNRSEVVGVAEFAFMYNAMKPETHFNPFRLQVEINLKTCDGACATVTVGGGQKRRRVHTAG